MLSLDAIAINYSGKYDIYVIIIVTETNEDNSVFVTMSKYTSKNTSKLSPNRFKKISHGRRLTLTNVF